MSLKASGGTGSAAGATATEPDPPQRIVAHDKGPEDPFAAKKLCRSVECRRPALFAVVHLLLPMNTSFWARQRPEKPGNPYSPFQTSSPKYTSSRLVAQVYFHEASRPSILAREALAQVYFCEAFRTSNLWQGFFSKYICACKASRASVLVPGLWSK